MDKKQLKSSSCKVKISNKNINLSRKKRQGLISFTKMRCKTYPIKSCFGFWNCGIQRTLQLFRAGFVGLGGHKTALIASSKTVLSPLVVKAEHSKYFIPLISLHMARP